MKILLLLSCLAILMLYGCDKELNGRISEYDSEPIDVQTVVFPLYDGVSGDPNLLQRSFFAKMPGQAANEALRQKYPYRINLSDELQLGELFFSKESCNILYKDYAGTYFKLLSPVLDETSNKIDKIDYSQGEKVNVLISSQEGHSLWVVGLNVNKRVFGFILPCEGVVLDRIRRQVGAGGPVGKGTRPDLVGIHELSRAAPRLEYSGRNANGLISVIDIKPESIDSLIVVVDAGASNKIYYEIERHLITEFLLLLEKTTHATANMDYPQVSGGDTEIYILNIDDRSNRYVFIPPPWEGLGKTPRVVLEKEGVKTPTGQYLNSSLVRDFLSSKGKVCPKEYVDSITGAMGIFANGTTTYSVWRNWRDSN